MTLDRRGFVRGLSATAVLPGVAGCAGLLGPQGRAFPVEPHPPGKRRLVLCLDGSLAKTDDATNIDWIAASCQGSEARPMPQLVAYFPGVGTQPGEELLGGGLGFGLARQIMDGYHFVQANWQPGDQIFIFGFARGAYASRSLASFIGLLGWIEDPELATMAYEKWYRLQGERDPMLRRLLQDSIVKITAVKPIPMEVEFLGLFDTVAALGFSNIDLPPVLREVSQIVSYSIDGFHRVHVGPHVRRVNHAVALDEMLAHFSPTLLGPVPDEVIALEVWFAGGHGDVGGGHIGPEDNRNLAKVALVWMMESARAAGLELKPEAWSLLRRQADPLAPQHYAPPNITPEIASALSLLKARAPRTVPDGAQISPSILKRRGKEVEYRGIDGMPAPRQRYEPRNLPARYARMAGTA